MLEAISLRLILCALFLFSISLYSEDLKNNASVKIHSCSFNINIRENTVICGTLSVPENYKQDNGNRVKLPFIIVTPTNSSDTKYPLLVAGGGGPGAGLYELSSELETFSDLNWIYWGFSTLHAGRPLIFIDNRGVGSAQPKLDCPEVEDYFWTSMTDINGRKEGMLKGYASAYKACKSRLTASGIDLSQYNLVTAAQDIEALRTQLDFEKLNIYGVSYGSRVALMYERLYPEQTRTLILDGVFPLFIKSHELANELVNDTFERLFGLCLENSKCHNQLQGDIKKEFLAYLRKLEKNPLTVSVTYKPDASVHQVLVDPTVLMNTLYFASYDQHVLSRIPIILRSIVNGGTDYLSELLRDYNIAQMTYHSLDEGAYASYTCADDIGYSDIEKEIKESANNELLQFANRDYLKIESSMCDVWAVPKLHQSIKEKQTIQSPMLLLSGFFDPVTPPSWAKELSFLAETSWSKTWHGLSHGIYWAGTCADEVARYFLDDPKANPFEYASCPEADEPLMLDL